MRMRRLCLLLTSSYQKSKNNWWTQVALEKWKRVKISFISYHKRNTSYSSFQKSYHLKIHWVTLVSSIPGRKDSDYFLNTQTLYFFISQQFDFEENSFLANLILDGKTHTTVCINSFLKVAQLKERKRKAPKIKWK